MRGWCTYVVAAGIAFGPWLTTTSRAQDVYELVIPNTETVSHAARDDQRLVILDAAGVRTDYSRAPRYDSPDGKYRAYLNTTVRQIIRWPVSDQGHLLLAEWNRLRRPEFRPSRMEIRHRGAGSEDVRPPRIGADDAFQLMPADQEWAETALGVARETDVALLPAREEARQVWLVAPVTDGFYRIHCHARGRRWCLTTHADGSVALDALGRNPSQFWQVVPAPGHPGFFVLVCAGEAAARPVLTVNVGGVLGLAPFAGTPRQLWRLKRLAIPLPSIFADYRFVSREVRPNPPLPPAKVSFLNDHDKELWVWLVDRLQPERSRRLKIPAGKSESLELVRDSGATLVEVYESGTAGFVQREELVTPLPPPVRYDASVYEVILQSVAIDRTVPGGKVEDVNYSPKSVGYFELPPGPALEDGTWPVFETARSLNNPGQVRRIVPEQWRSGKGEPHPIERLLREFQDRAP